MVRFGDKAVDFSNRSLYICNGGMQDRIRDIVGGEANADKTFSISSLFSYRVSS